MIGNPKAIRTKYFFGSLSIPALSFVVIVKLKTISGDDNAAISGFWLPARQLRPVRGN